MGNELTGILNQDIAPILNYKVFQPEGHSAQSCHLQNPGIYCNRPPRLFQGSSVPGHTGQTKSGTYLSVYVAGCRQVFVSVPCDMQHIYCTVYGLNKCFFISIE
jgi:hypothetical protein